MTTETKPRLDRRQVLEAAIELIDREGLDALTIRRLANELDVDPMTIHHHAGGKESLLDGVTELLWEEVDSDGQADPEGILRLLATSVRELFHRHPEAAPLVLRCSDLSRSELELWRIYLDALAATGVEQPGPILRSVLTYALGTGNAEVAMLGLPSDSAAPSRTYSDRELMLYLGQALPQGTPPELISAAVEVIADCDADRCFRNGLDLMLAGLAARQKGL